MQHLKGKKCQPQLECRTLVFRQLHIGSRSNGLKEELEQRASGLTWVVAFYAAWSPASINFAPVFSKISSAYNLPNLKFGKLLRCELQGGASPMRLGHLGWL